MFLWWKLVKIDFFRTDIKECQHRQLTCITGQQVEHLQVRELCLIKRAIFQNWQCPISQFIRVPQTSSRYRNLFHGIARLVRGWFHTLTASQTGQGLLRGTSQLVQWIECSISPTSRENLGKVLIMTWSFLT